MNSKTVIFIILSILLVSCSGEKSLDTSDAGSTSIAVPANSTPGIIRIKLDHELPESELTTAFLAELGPYKISRTFPYAGRFEARHRKAGLNLWYDITFDKSLSLTKAAGSVKKLDGVDIIEFDQPIKAESVSFPFNDPYFSKQWHYYNTGSVINGNIAGSDINLLPAWTVTTGTPNVIVAVNDQGVDYTHEDLAQNMWVNTAELNGKADVDDDNNGFVDDIYGYNFTVSGSSEAAIGTIVPGDHGTHVAGTIAAVNNNGKGVCGIAGGNGSKNSGVRLMSTQVLDGSAYTARSMVYAADMGAVLMNCSWGFEDAKSTPESVVQAIDYFNKNAGMDPDSGTQTGPMAGGLMIFAAGNANASTAYPAMESGVMAVASIGGDYARAYYSNYGDWVDITAPGGDAQKGALIMSSVTNSSYGTMQGTSMAAPHVTGVAALVVSKFGGEGFTRADLIEILQKTANKKIYDYNKNYAGQLGAGLVDAYAAVTYSGFNSPQKVTEVKGTPSSNTVVLNWTLPGTAGTKSSFTYNIYYSKKSLASLDIASPSSDVKKLSFSPESASAGDAVSYTVSGLDFNTEYHFRIAVENIRGVFSELSPEITVKTLSNSRPVITALDGSAITLKSFATGTLRFSIKDADGDPMTYSLSSGLDGATASLVDGVITLTINALNAIENKTYSGILSVTDSHEVSTAGFAYTILANTPPVVSATIPDMVLSSSKESTSLSISGYFSDADGETLTYSSSVSSGNVARCNISNGNLNVNASAYGTTSVTVTAVDARGAKASQTFQVLVRDGSRAVDLYPNPVTDYLHIRSGATESATIEVFSETGAVVFRSQAVEIGPFAPYKLDMTSLPGGVYSIKVKVSGSEAKTYSIVKK